MKWWQRRQLRKAAEELLHHAGHVRAMREDVATAADLAALKDAVATLRAALRARDDEALLRASEATEKAVARIAPPKARGFLKDHVEVIVVALAIAMGVRAYFLQPFKIPTGSMQPTLYGIHYEPTAGPDWTDLWPVNLLRWAVTGSWYCEYKAQCPGRLRGPLAESEGMHFYDIGGRPHPIPRDLPLLVRQGEEVLPGQMLARGRRFSGDHLFVTKWTWNFRRPRRGEVMVFSTDGIPALQAKRTHYIKRMVGLPTEEVAIDPPHLIIDGLPVHAPWTITRIADQLPGYEAGYVPGGPSAQYLAKRGDRLRLKETEYAGFGDNTRNSFDSRYWGPIPQASLVGPGSFVYWPISRRWGPIW